MLNAPVAPTYPSGKPSHPVSADARAAALVFLRQLAAELSSGTVNLPCFPDVVLRIRKALADPKNTPARTVSIVGAEPRLAARLMQSANSAAFNPTGKTVTDLRHAITRLGHQIVQSSAMAFAVQHMKDEASLRSIAEPLSALWRKSITVALLCQIVAGRTRITPDEAFLTGLLHGIGRLYIMVRAIGKTDEFKDPEAFIDLVSGWQATIGKSVLENWGFAPPMCEALADQADYERPRQPDADLSDVLIVSIALCEGHPMGGIAAFETIGLSDQDCADIMAQAARQLDSLQSALGG